MSIGRKRVAKHIPVTTNISVAMQRAVNTIEEVMFSMDPSRNYASSPVVEREREWSESSAVRGEGLG
jgi:hypothetical protein